MTFIEGSPNNPHPPQTDAWWDWENDRIEREAKAKLEEMRREWEELKKSSPEPQHEVIDAVYEIHLILKMGLLPAQEKLMLIALRKKLEQAGEMTAFEFNDLVKAVRQELKSVHYRSELKTLLQIDDEIDRDRQIAILAPKYQMGAALISKHVQMMKRLTTTVVEKSKSIAEFFDEETEALNWLIPELLPQGETVLLVSPPKDGKTLLALDAAFALATGEDEFLGHKFSDRKKVLIISVDESAQSTKAKLIKRGFRRKDLEYVRVKTKWDITQMQSLEKELEDFRPDLVVVDSLKRITAGQELSENSAEFADTIYQLKELFNRYMAAGILIHHTNKNPEAMGVARARGSSAIAGACWGQWQLERIPTPDPHNKKKMRFDPKDRRRLFSAFNRDSDGVSLHIEFNPENNSWINNGETGAEEEQQQQQTIRQRVMTLLELNQHRKLSGRDIIELLRMEEEKGSVYSELSRMVSKRLINCQPASEDKRYNVYSLPKTEVSTGTLDFQPPPSPPGSVLNADYVAETFTQSELDNSQQISQQIVSNSQQLFESNFQNLDTESNSNSQQATPERGGEGLLETEESNNTNTEQSDDSDRDEEAAKPRIEVGMKVIWTKAHAHLSWMGTFVVEAIEGGMAKLDYLSHLVPLEDLRLV